MRVVFAGMALLVALCRLGPFGGLPTAAAARHVNRSDSNHKTNYFGAANPGGYHCIEHNNKLRQLVRWDFRRLGLFDAADIQFIKHLVYDHDAIYKFERGLVPFTPAAILAMLSDEGRQLRAEWGWDRTKLAMAKTILPALDVPLNIPPHASGRVPKESWLDVLTEKEKQFFHRYLERAPIENVEQYLQRVPKARRRTVLLLAHYLHLEDILAPNSGLPVESYRYLAALEKEAERSYGRHSDMLRTNYDFLRQPEDRYRILRVLAEKHGIQGFTPKHRNLEEFLQFIDKKSPDRGARYRAVMRMYELLKEGKSAKEAILAANQQLEQELGRPLPKRAYTIPE